MDITVFESLKKEEFNYLISLLQQITIPKKTKTNNRRGFGLHRAITFGIVRGRFNGLTQLSYHSKKYPFIYEEICRIGKLICPFEFNAIHLNHNVVCPKHTDSKNTNESVLISFGDYTGCNIVINNKIYDAKYTPIMFDGKTLEHYNTDDLIGNKYSLVFFNGEKCLNK